MAKSKTTAKKNESAPSKKKTASEWKAKKSEDAIVKKFLNDPSLVGEPPWLRVLREIDPEGAAKFSPGELPDVETMKRIIEEGPKRSQKKESLTKMLAIKVSPTMLGELNQAAKSRGVPRADFVRKVLLRELEGHKQKARPQKKAKSGQKSESSGGFAEGRSGDVMHHPAT